MSDELPMNWFVYILCCADNTLYTGITTDLSQRLRYHNLGRGAKYTAQRLPVTLLWSEPAESRSAALKREFAIKQLTRQEKIKLASHIK